MSLKKPLQQMLTKGTALFVCAVFLSTSVSVPQAKAEISPTSVAAYRSLLDDMSTFTLPKEIGKIQETYRGTSDKVVVLVQDAHSIPDAQRNIRSVINHFQTTYGISLVGLEGASEKLDPQIFKSFPDKRLLAKVFEEYSKRGELTGGNAAALALNVQGPSRTAGKDAAVENGHFGNSNIQHPISNIIFQGVEDWPLYEEGVSYFLKAMGMEPEILALLDPIEATLNREKETVYPKELLEIDRLLASFAENKTELTQVLIKLSQYQLPPKSSELAVLLDELQSDQSTSTPVDLEIKKITEKVLFVLKAQTATPEIRQELQEFQAKQQEYQTSRISAQDFALSLKDLVKKYKIRVKVSRKLAGLVENQKRIKDIEGTRLFEEFKNYAEEVKGKLILDVGSLMLDKKTSIQDPRSNIQDPVAAIRLLERQTQALDLLKRLTSLELSFEDWETVQKMITQLDQWTVAQNDGAISRDDVSAILKRMEPHLAFYRVAEKRDQVFLKNIQAIMTKQEKTSSLLVAGGFHTEGLTRTLKASGISYVLVMPQIGSIPEEPLYREHMQGKVSWSDYFEVKDGKVNLYEAFVRGTRDRLLGITSGTAPTTAESDKGQGRATRDRLLGMKNEKLKMKNEGDADASSDVAKRLPNSSLYTFNFSLLKGWRDQILRDLSASGRITEAGQYTRFIDEVTHPSSLSPQHFKDQWLANIDRFAAGLKKLHSGGQLSETGVQQLIKSITTANTAEPALAAFLAPRAEVRTELLPSVDRREMRNLAKQDGLINLRMIRPEQTRELQAIAAEAKKQAAILYRAADPENPSIVKAAGSLEDIAERILDDRIEKYGLWVVENQYRQIARMRLIFSCDQEKLPEALRKENSEEIFESIFVVLPMEQKRGVGREMLLQSWRDLQKSYPKLRYQLIVVKPTNLPSRRAFWRAAAFSKTKIYGPLESISPINYLLDLNVETPMQPWMQRFMQDHDIEEVTEQSFLHPKSRKEMRTKLYTQVPGEPNAPGVSSSDRHEMRSTTELKHLTAGAQAGTRTNGRPLNEDERTPLHRALDEVAYHIGIGNDDVAEEMLRELMNDFLEITKSGSKLQEVMEKWNKQYPSNSFMISNAGIGGLLTDAQDLWAEIPHNQEDRTWPRFPTSLKDMGVTDASYTGYVNQREAVIANNGLLVTDGLGPCVAVVLWNADTKAGALMHFDRVADAKYLESIIESIGGVGSNIRASIIFGTNPRFVRVHALKRALIRQLNLAEDTVIDRYKSSNGSVALNLETGELNIYKGKIARGTPPSLGKFIIRDMRTNVARAAEIKMTPGTSPGPASKSTGLGKPADKSGETRYELRLFDSVKTSIKNILDDRLLMKGLSKVASETLKAQKNFVRTQSEPFPSMSSGNSFDSDLAALLHHKVDTVILPRQQNAATFELMSKARALGATVLSVWNKASADEWADQEVFDYLISWNRETAEELQGLYEKAVKGKMEIDAAFRQKFGELLGIAPEARTQDLVRHYGFDPYEADYIQVNPADFETPEGFPDHRLLLEIMRQEKIAIQKPQAGDLSFGFLIRGRDTALDYITPILQGRGAQNLDVWSNTGLQDMTMNGGLYVDLDYEAFAYAHHTDPAEQFTTRDLRKKLGIPLDAKKLLVIAGRKSGQRAYQILREEIFHGLENIGNAWVHIQEPFNDFIQMLFAPSAEAAHAQKYDYTHFSLNQIRALRARYLEVAALHPSTPFQSILERFKKDLGENFVITVEGEMNIGLADLFFPVAIWSAKLLLPFSLEDYGLEQFQRNAADYIENLMQTERFSQYPVLTDLLLRQESQLENESENVPGPQGSELAAASGTVAAGRASARQEMRHGVVAEQIAAQRVVMAAIADELMNTVGRDARYGGPDYVIQKTLGDITTADVIEHLHRAGATDEQIGNIDPLRLTLHEKIEIRLIRDYGLSPEEAHALAKWLEELILGPRAGAALSLPSADATAAAVGLDKNPAAVREIRQQMQGIYVNELESWINQIKNSTHGVNVEAELGLRIEAGGEFRNFYETLLTLWRDKYDGAKAGVGFGGQLVPNELKPFIFFVLQNIPVFEGIQQETAQRLLDAFRIIIPMAAMDQTSQARPQQNSGGHFFYQPPKLQARAIETGRNEMRVETRMTEQELQYLGKLDGVISEFKRGKDAFDQALVIEHSLMRPIMDREFTPASDSFFVALFDRVPLAFDETLFGKEEAVLADMIRLALINGKDFNRFIEGLVGYLKKKPEAWDFRQVVGVVTRALNSMPPQARREAAGRFDSGAYLNEIEGSEFDLTTKILLSHLALFLNKDSPEDWDRLFDDLWDRYGADAQNELIQMAPQKTPEDEALIQSSLAKVALLVLFVRQKLLSDVASLTGRAYGSRYLRLMDAQESENVGSVATSLRYQREFIRDNVKTLDFAIAIYAHEFSHYSVDVDDAGEEFVADVFAMALCEQLGLDDKAFVEALKYSDNYEAVQGNPEIMEAHARARHLLSVYRHLFGWALSDGSQRFLPWRSMAEVIVRKIFKIDRINKTHADRFLGKIAEMNFDEFSSAFFKEFGPELSGLLESAAKKYFPGLTVSDVLKLYEDRAIVEWTRDNGQAARERLEKSYSALTIAELLEERNRFGVAIEHSLGQEYSEKEELVYPRNILQRKLAVLDHFIADIIFSRYQQAGEKVRIYWHEDGQLNNVEVSESLAREIAPLAAFVPQLIDGAPELVATGPYITSATVNEMILETEAADKGDVDAGTGGTVSESAGLGQPAGEEGERKEMRTTALTSRAALNQFMAWDESLPYDPQKLLGFVIKNPMFTDYYYERLGFEGTGREILLKDHTLDVMNNFEAYDFKTRLPKVTGLKLLPLIRLALVLHDIGKPLANREGKPELQHDYSVDLIKVFMSSYSFTTDEINFVTALVGADPIGKLLQQKITIDQAREMIREQARKAGLDEKTFFLILSMYYSADAYAYDFLKDSFKINRGRLELMPFKTEFYILQDLIWDNVPVPPATPSLSELEDKVYAIHVTVVLPKKGKAIAGKLDVTKDKRWKGDVPGFRPTLHWSLGSMVPPHAKGSWEDCTYAIVTKLGNLKKQLVSLDPYDSFSLGNFDLQSADTFLLVPQGTNVAEMPPGVALVEYDPQLSLREAIDNFIQLQKGWPIRMIGGTGDNLPFYIGGHKIERKDFFKNLMTDMPHMSLGTHTDSQRGTAFRFGLLDHYMDILIEQYSTPQSKSNQLPTNIIRFCRTLISHHLQELELSLRQAGYSKETMDVFEREKHRMLAWLNVVDADLRLRAEKGKTLVNHNPEDLFRARMSPEGLQRIIDQSLGVLPDLKENQNSSENTRSASEHCSSLAPEELTRLLEQYPTLLEFTDLNEFYVHYAIQRWLLIGETRAFEEKLDRILSDALHQKIQPSQPKKNYEFLKTLSKDLFSVSEKLETALGIMRQTAVRDHLADYEGMVFENGQPASLADIIRVHPDTRILFEETGLPPDSDIRMSILRKLGRVHELDVDKEILMQNFQWALFKARELRALHERLREDIVQIEQPMNSTRSHEELSRLSFGSSLSRYEQWRRSEEIGEIWDELGLRVQFGKSEFSDPEVFWQSDLSFVQIYHNLINRWDIPAIDQKRPSAPPLHQAAESPLMPLKVLQDETLEDVLVHNFASENDKSNWKYLRRIFGPRADRVVQVDPLYMRRDRVTVNLPSPAGELFHTTNLPITVLTLADEPWLIRFGEDYVLEANEGLVFHVVHQENGKDGPGNYAVPVSQADELEHFYFALELWGRFQLLNGEDPVWIAKTVQAVDRMKKAAEKMAGASQPAKGSAYWQQVANRDQVIRLLYEAHRVQERIRDLFSSALRDLRPEETTFDVLLKALNMNQDFLIQLESELHELGMRIAVRMENVGKGAYLFFDLVKADSPDSGLNEKISDALMSALYKWDSKRLLAARKVAIAGPQGRYQERPEYIAVRLQDGDALIDVAAGQIDQGKAGPIVMTRMVQDYEVQVANSIAVWNRQEQELDWRQSYVGQRSSQLDKGTANLSKTRVEMRSKVLDRRIYDGAFVAEEKAKREAGIITVAIDFDGVLEAWNYDYDQKRGNERITYFLREGILDQLQKLKDQNIRLVGWSRNTETELIRVLELFPKLKDLLDFVIPGEAFEILGQRFFDKKYQGEDDLGAIYTPEQIEKIKLNHRKFGMTLKDVGLLGYSAIIDDELGKYVGDLPSGPVPVYNPGKFVVSHDGHVIDEGDVKTVADDVIRIINVPGTVSKSAGLGQPVGEADGRREMRAEQRQEKFSFVYGDETIGGMMEIVEDTDRYQIFKIKSLTINSRPIETSGRMIFEVYKNEKAVWIQYFFPDFPVDGKRGRGRALLLHLFNKSKYPGYRLFSDATNSPEFQRSWRKMPADFQPLVKGSPGVPNEEFERVRAEQERQAKENYQRTGDDVDFNLSIRWNIATLYCRVPDEPNMPGASSSTSFAERREMRKDAIALANRAALEEAMMMRTMEEAKQYLKDMGIAHLMPQWVLPVPADKRYKLKMGREFLGQLGFASEAEAEQLFSVFSIPTAAYDQLPEPLRTQARIAFSSRSGQRAVLFPVKQGILLDGEKYHLIQVRGVGIAEYARYIGEYGPEETVRFNERIDRRNYGDTPLDMETLIPEEKYGGRYARDAGLFRGKTVYEDEMKWSAVLWDIPELRSLLARDIMAFDVEGYLDARGQHHPFSEVEGPRVYAGYAACVTLHHSAQPRLREIIDNGEAAEAEKHPNLEIKGVTGTERFKHEKQEYEGVKKSLEQWGELHQDGDVFGTAKYFPMFLAKLIAALVNRQLNSDQMTLQNLKLNEFSDFHHFQNAKEFVEARSGGYLESQPIEELIRIGRGHFREAYVKDLKARQKAQTGKTDSGELFWPYYIMEGDLKHGFELVLMPWLEFATTRLQPFGWAGRGAMQRLYLETFFNALTLEARTQLFFYMADFCLYAQENGKPSVQTLDNNVYLTQGSRTRHDAWLFETIAAHFDLPVLSNLKYEHYWRLNIEGVKQLRQDLLLKKRELVARARSLSGVHSESAGLAESAGEAGGERLEMREKSVEDKQLQLMAIVEKPLAPTELGRLLERITSWSWVPQGLISLIIRLFIFVTHPEKQVRSKLKAIGEIGKIWEQEARSVRAPPLRKFDLMENLDRLIVDLRQHIKEHPNQTFEEMQQALLTPERISGVSPRDVVKIKQAMLHYQVHHQRFQFLQLIVPPLQIPENGKKKFTLDEIEKQPLLKEFFETIMGCVPYEAVVFHQGTHFHFLLDDYAFSIMLSLPKEVKTGPQVTDVREMEWDQIKPLLLIQGRYIAADFVFRKFNVRKLMTFERSNQGKIVDLDHANRGWLLHEEEHLVIDTLGQYGRVFEEIETNLAQPIDTYSPLFGTRSQLIRWMRNYANGIRLPPGRVLNEIEIIQMLVRMRTLNHITRGMEYSAALDLVRRQTLNTLKTPYGRKWNALAARTAVLGIRLAGQALKSKFSEGLVKDMVKMEDAWEVLHQNMPETDKAFSRFRSISALAHVSSESLLNNVVLISSGEHLPRNAAIEAIKHFIASEFQMEMTAPLTEYDKIRIGLFAFELAAMIDRYPPRDRASYDWKGIDPWDFLDALRSLQQVKQLNINPGEFYTSEYWDTLAYRFFTQDKDTLELSLVAEGRINTQASGSTIEVRPLDPAARFFVLTVNHANETLTTADGSVISKIEVRHIESSRTEIGGSGSPVSEIIGAGQPTIEPDERGEMRHGVIAEQMAAQRVVLAAIADELQNTIGRDARYGGTDFVIQKTLGDITSADVIEHLYRAGATDDQIRNVDPLRLTLHEKIEIRLIRDYDLSPEEAHALAKWLEELILGPRDGAALSPPLSEATATAPIEQNPAAIREIRQQMQQLYVDELEFWIAQIKNSTHGINVEADLNRRIEMGGRLCNFYRTLLALWRQDYQGAKAGAGFGGQLVPDEIKPFIVFVLQSIPVFEGILQETSQRLLDAFRVVIPMAAIDQIAQAQPQRTSGSTLFYPQPKLQARAIEIERKEMRSRAELLELLKRDYTEHAVTNVERQDGYAGERSMFKIELTDVGGEHRIYFEIWSDRAEQIARSAGHEFQGNVKEETLAWLQSIRFYIHQSGFSAKKVSGPELYLNVGGRIAAIKTSNLFVFKGFSPAKPFSSFPEEKEFYRYRDASVKILGWNNLESDLDGTLEPVMPFFNQIPFLYSAGWSHSGAPRDYLALGRYGPDGWRSSLVNDEVRQFTGHDYCGYAVFRADEEDENYPRWVEAIQQAGDTDWITHPEDPAKKVLVVRVPVEAQPELLQDMAAYQAWVENKWKQLAAVSGEFISPKEGGRSAALPATRIPGLGVGRQEMRPQYGVAGAAKSATRAESQTDQLGPRPEIRANDVEVPVMIKGLIEKEKQKAKERAKSLANAIINDSAIEDGELLGRQRDGSFIYLLHTDNENFPDVIVILDRDGKCVGIAAPGANSRYRARDGRQGVEYYLFAADLLDSAIQLKFQRIIERAMKAIPIHDRSAELYLSGRIMLPVINPLFTVEEFLASIERNPILRRLLAILGETNIKNLMTKMVFYEEPPQEGDLEGKWAQFRPDAGDAMVAIERVHMPRRALDGVLVHELMHAVFDFLLKQNPEVLRKLVVHVAGNRRLIDFIKGQYGDYYKTDERYHDEAIAWLLQFISNGFSGIGFHHVEVPITDQEIQALTEAGVLPAGAIEGLKANYPKASDHTQAQPAAEPVNSQGNNTFLGTPTDIIFRPPPMEHHFIKELRIPLFRDSRRTGLFRRLFAGFFSVFRKAEPPRQASATADRPELRFVMVNALAQVLKPGTKSPALSSEDAREVELIVLNGRLDELIDLLKKAVEIQMAKAEVAAQQGGAPVRVRKDMADDFIEKIINVLKASGIKGNLTIAFDVAADKSFLEALQSVKAGIGTAVFTSEEARRLRALDRDALEGMTVQTVPKLEKYKTIVAENEAAVPVLTTDLESDYFSNPAFFGVGLNAEGVENGEPFLEVAENALRMVSGLLIADLRTRKHLRPSQQLKAEEIKAELLKILPDGVITLRDGRHLIVNGSELMQHIVSEYQTRNEVRKAA